MVDEATYKDMSPQDYVQAVVAESGSSFFWAMRLLEENRRDANFAVYAFCRIVDDIADDEGISVEERKAGLSEWRNEMAKLYSGAASHPIAQALAPFVADFSLKCEDFLAVIEGMEMDAEGPIVAPSYDALLYYCDRVAAAVGRLCVKIYGEGGNEGQLVADHLGLALQLTNILRDVREDAERGRLYLPHELLDKYGIESRDPMVAAEHDNLPKLCAELGARAEAEFQAAREALKATDRKKMKPAIIMMEVYHRILRQLRDANWRLPQNPSLITRVFDKGAKLSIALRYGLF